MKVNLCQISEETGKTVYPERKKMKKTYNNSEDFNDEEDESLAEDAKKSEEIRYISSVINFEDVGIFMSLYGIESLEKDVKFVEKPTAHWEYGIVINKGMEQSIRFPKVDVGVWFIKEEIRDKRWSSMLKRLEEEGFKIIEV